MPHHRRKLVVPELSFQVGGGTWKEAHAGGNGGALLSSFLPTLVRLAPQFHFTPFGAHDHLLHLITPSPLPISPHTFCVVTRTWFPRRRLSFWVIGETCINSRPARARADSHGTAAGRLAWRGIKELAASLSLHWDNPQRQRTASVLAVDRRWAKGPDGMSQDSDMGAHETEGRFELGDLGSSRRLDAPRPGAHVSTYANSRHCVRGKERTIMGRMRSQKSKLWHRITRHQRIWGQKLRSA